MLCSIDVETTGLTAGYHDLIEVAFVPDDININTLHIRMKALHPSRSTKGAQDKHGLDIRKGVSTATGYQKFYAWTQRHKITRIEPLGHNYNGLDGPFLKSWIGKRTYGKLFDHRVRDTCGNARFLKDGGLIDPENCSLETLLKYHNIPIEKLHSAKHDAEATLALYKLQLELINGKILHAPSEPQPPMRGRTDYVRP